MRELLSDNSLFVDQLYEDKSLALRARDLIFYDRQRRSQNAEKVAHINGRRLYLAKILYIYVPFESGNFS